MSRRDKLIRDLNSLCIAVILFLIILPFMLRAGEHEREKYIGRMTYEYEEYDPIAYMSSSYRTSAHDIVISTTKEKKYPDWVDESMFRINVTESDIDLMARVVMSEASLLDTDAKQAVATVIVNRVLSDYKSYAYVNSVTEAIIPGQFSTSDNGEVTEDCYDAVYAALMYEGFPSDMLWFWKSPECPSYMHLYLELGNDMWATYFFTLEDYGGFER